MSERCPYCGHILEKPYLYIVDKKAVDKRRYRVEYRCPVCGRRFSLIKTRRKIDLKGKENETDFTISLLPISEKTSIILRNKKRGHTQYVEHNIFTKNARVDHIGIKGIRGWRNNEVQFKNKRKEIVEFSEKEYGKTTRKWRKQ